MGGIGKTTIMKHIHNQLLEETKALFDKIIWVTVSKELNIPDLQEKLADALNIADLPESEPERVAELMEKLRQRRYVLILDDVWERFSLAEVGIPKPTSSNGSKLVLTSRSIEVCRSMDCKVVKVPPLSHEESMNLFLEHAGHGVLKVPSLKKILGNIVRECAGSMKGIYDVAEWRNALRELRDHVRSVKGTDVEIYKRLKFSFDRLGDLKIQKNYIISREELVEYWIDEEFLGTGSRQELYDRGHTILNRLENNSLLEKVDRDNVKMHDVMRDTALYIKSSGPRFMVKSGIGLKELPSKQEWGEDLEKVSIMMNNVLEIPPNLSPKCEVLSTLLLQNNKSLQSISESFFQHMHSLSILDISYTNIEQLPNSVSKLEKLKALVLHGCYNLRYVPSLEKLEALRKLDLYHTAIEKEPEGLEMLSNLTYLNLCIQSLKKLPVAILPRLFCLQCLVLYVKSSSVEMNGFDPARLTKLEIFQGRFTELIDFNAYTKSIQGQELTSYLLVMAQLKAKFKVNESVLIFIFFFVMEFSIQQYNELTINTLFKLRVRVKIKLYILTISFISFRIFLTVEGVESVFFNRENGLLEMVGNVDIVRFVNKLRKYIYVEILSIVPNRWVPDPVVLPTDLMCLRIFEFHNVRSLSDISIFFQQANQLRVCSVEDCKGIESILDSSLSNSLCSPLENLEYLWLERLDNLHRKRFTREKGINTPMKFNLPKLRELELKNLPKLKSICGSNTTMVCNSLRKIEVSECTNLKRMPLSIPLFQDTDQSVPCAHPFEVICIYPKEWWESVEWDYPKAKEVLLP
ncbi:hypothetical protein E1A91_A01G045000v1, partial [Gossypium mustelinum]